MIRKSAKDHKNVDALHRPGYKPGILKQIMTPPVIRGGATPVSPTQPDTRRK